MAKKKFNVGDIVMALGDNSKRYIVGTIIKKIKESDCNYDGGAYRIEWSDGTTETYSHNSVIRYQEILDAYTKNKL